MSEENLVPMLIMASIFFFLWLLIISLLLVRISRHYNRLTGGLTSKNLTRVLEEILKKGEISKDEISKLIKRCDKIEEENKFHIQKLGLVRFNPFSDTGGDQSFVLAILDQHNNGVIVSSLHGRDQTRWYAKIIKNSEGKNHQLSKEEKQAIENAKMKNEK